MSKLSFGSCVNRNETGATCGGNSFPFTAAVKNAHADVSGCLFRWQQFGRL